MSKELKELILHFQIYQKKSYAFFVAFVPANSLAFYGCTNVGATEYKFYIHGEFVFIVE